MLDHAGVFCEIRECTNNTESGGLWNELDKFRTVTVPVPRLAKGAKTAEWQNYKRVVIKGVDLVWLLRLNV